MADDNKPAKDDIYALEKDTPDGKRPAYPKMLYRETGEKYKDGSPVTDNGTVVKNPDEHKAWLNEKKAPSWGKDK